MKIIGYKVLVALLLCCNQMLAQSVLLPFGQDTKEPWEAKYYFAPNQGSTPEDNWMAPDFDDSGWQDIQGPISSTNANYSPSKWGATYATYWLRRHFTMDKTNWSHVIYLRALFDDTIEAYLNGHLIYSNMNYVTSIKTIDVTNEIYKYLKEGDNVFAVKTSDIKGGESYIDFGLIGYFMRNVENGDFSSNSAWTGSFNRGSSNDNYVAYKYGRNWTCEQSLINNPEGLYMLTANACGLDYYNNFNIAYNAKDKELAAKLFINDVEMSIPNAFSETAETDIYQGRSWQVDGGYVPNTENYTQRCFERDMYKSKVIAYYVPDSANVMTVGIHCYSDNDINRWAAWDNINLAYIEEDALATMLDSLVLEHKSMSAKHQDKTVKGVLDAYLADAAKAKSYKEKGQVYAAMSQYEPTVRKTVEAYDRLYATQQLLADSLTKTTAHTSPATIAEATAYAGSVLAAYTDGTYDNDEVAAAISAMDKMMERLGYLYLDINVATPGSLGDSILAKVENFVDVYSLKISGTLNDADLNNIKTRLTNLRELDMTDVNMTDLPNRMFYQRKALEIVKLPKQLVTIGEYAFYQCYGLQHIDFPATLTTIYNYGFSECDNLQEVILPEGFNSLGTYAFYSCDNNKYLKLPTTLEIVTDYSFYQNVNLSKIDFAEGLIKIFNHAFYGCKSLTELKFPSSLYYTGDNVFSYCTSIEKIEFNEGLYRMYDNGFTHLDALTEVTLPSTLVLMNASPFDYCANLRKVTCHSIEPPYMTDQIPYGCDMAGRELYVPALSINVYKQTAGWDKFQTIKPIDYLPESIAVYRDLHLTLPETMPVDYKPSMTLLNEKNSDYGTLTVNGSGTLSLSNFSTTWDFDAHWYQPSRLINSNSLITNSNMRADTVMVNTVTRREIWSFVSYPFDVKVSEIATPAEDVTNWIIRKYDGKKRAEGETNNTWVKLTNDSILHAGEGYIIMGDRYSDGSRRDYSIFTMTAVNNANKNNIFSAGNVNVQLKEYQSEFAHNRSWNLIGNPYPCYYDTRYMDYNAPITVWSLKNKTYSAYSPVDDSYILCPGEAFFVQRPIDKESITFGKDGRQTDRTVRTLDTPARIKANECAARTVINLTISDGQTADRTRIVLNDNASTGYETDKDAPKFMSTDNSVPQLYSTMGGVDYAINERPAGEGYVLLSAHFGYDGQYSISIDREVSDYEITLEDKLTGKTIALGQGSEYVFTADAGTDTGRFIIYFDNTTTGLDSIDRESEDQDAYYTIDGVKISKPTYPGIYIHNNKKIYVK